MRGVFPAQTHTEKLQNANLKRNKSTTFKAAELSPVEIALTFCLSHFAINLFIQNYLMLIKGPLSACFILSP